MQTAGDSPEAGNTAAPQPAFTGPATWSNPQFRAYITRIRAEVDAADANRTPQRPEDLAKIRADLDAVTAAAKEHVSILISPRGRVARCLLRTLVRPGHRKVRDVGAYAAESFRADPDKWRTIAVEAFEAPSSYIDEENLTDARGELILSRRSARARGEDYDAYTMAKWNPDGRYSHLDLRDSSDQRAA